MIIPYSSGQSFRDVVVVPYSDLLDRWRDGEIHRGGPVWPDWDAQLAARHGRGGRPSMSARRIPRDRSRRRGRWPGPGPLSIRSGTSWPTSPAPAGDARDAAGPAHRLRHAAGPGLDEPATAPGLLPGHPRLVRCASTAGRSSRHPRASASCSWPPRQSSSADRARTRLPRRPRRAHPERLGRAVATRLLYVSRAAMEARFAGERYLEEVLGAAGFRVLRPETLALAEQLAPTVRRRAWSSRRVPRCMPCSSGALDADVRVLERRPGTRLAEANLQPRVRDLAYEEVATGLSTGSCRPVGRRCPRACRWPTRVGSSRPSPAAG